MENAVSLKLPSFWSQQPRIWFAQAEGQFAIRKVTDEQTKFNYLVAALDQESATRALDVIEEAPVTNPYKMLKDRLLDSFQLSEYERASALLHMAPLGDQKPSQLMDKMLGLLGTNKPDFLFRQIFLEHLPEQIRAVLVHSGVTACRELAKKEDSLYEANQQATPQINKIHSKKPSATDKSDKSDKQKSEKRLCFYHKRWGAKAHRCVIPCTWEGNPPAGPQ